MSTDAISLVKGRRFGSTAAKTVMLVLADYADSEWSSFVGQKRLSAEAEVGERTVRRILSELEGAGVLVRERRYRDDGYRTSDRTVLVRDAISGLPATVAAKTLPATDDTLTGQSLAAQEPPGEPREPKGSRDTSVSTEEIGAWTALEDLFGEVSTKGEKNRRGKLVKSLNGAGATFSEVKRRADAWHELFPPSNGGRGPTLTDHALEKWWGQLGKVVADRPAEFDPEACVHPGDRRASIDEVEFCGVCRREL